jgi:membrane protease YdiL (CAAX protease family)
VEFAEQITRKGWVIARGSPHPFILEQASTLQPKLAILLLSLFVPTWLPTLITHGLMLWPRFASLASEHRLGYRIVFFLVQFSLICGAVGYLTGKYRSAIWMPQPSWRRGIAVSLITSLPLLILHLFVSVQRIQAIIVLSSLGAQGTQALEPFYREVWGQLAYGLSGTGVLFSSFLSFTAPVLEEMVFTGFAVNAIGKRCGFIAAAVGAAACFAVAHAVQFGIGAHLIFLFFAGITYTMIRIFSGSLVWAVLAHLTINAVVFLPKWLLAAIHFARD